ncbi:MAG TPA: NAD(P)-binding protein [Micromonosporaceae bacterium]|nr:NAD(P)-binding protein [Micromonosporaceae bacterium]
MTKALIIGSGIAGMVTAIALRKAGVEAAVFEAAGTTADGIGAYLTLSVNGLAALETLDLKPTLYGGFDTPRMVLSSAAGRWQMELSTGRPLPGGRRSAGALRLSHGAEVAQRQDGHHR